MGVKKASEIRKEMSYELYRLPRAFVQSIFCGLKSLVKQWLLESKVDVSTVQTVDLCRK